MMQGATAARHHQGGISLFSTSESETHCTYTYLDLDVKGDVPVCVSPISFTHEMQ
jgi:hypothetical protein